MGYGSQEAQNGSPAEEPRLTNVRPSDKGNAAHNGGDLLPVSNHVAHVAEIGTSETQSCR